MEFRCSKCNKLLARYTQCETLEIKCTRCGLHNSKSQLNTSDFNYQSITPLDNRDDIQSIYRNKINPD